MSEPCSARAHESRDGASRQGETRQGEARKDELLHVPAVEQRLRTTRIRGDERFRQTQRLRSSREFQYVRRRGRSLAAQLLTLAYSRAYSQTYSREMPSMPGSSALNAAPVAKLAPSRVGFSVSKRVGNAVVRNLVKRRLRESVRRDLTRLAPGWDIVITARPAAASATYDQLRGELTSLLVRARLLPREEARGAGQHRGEAELH